MENPATILDSVILVLSPQINSTTTAEEADPQKKHLFEVFPQHTMGILDETDTKSLPSLVYPSASPLMESSAFATDGDHSDEGLITIPTHDMVWALNNFHHYAPAIESCQQRRAADWARTQLFIDDHYERHEDVEL
ncbi:hypothetical protein K438DRAFT_1995947 [Mycena galopus ATCC 62051]|nr:hypothetical protein K438DRAFT_1995947 [Mycena galopus ATCC 62051]